MWRDLPIVNRIVFERANCSATENAIEPLKQQLSQIEVNIKEYRDMIDTTRANILQNEAKIERLYMTEI